MSRLALALVAAFAAGLAHGESRPAVASPPPGGGYAIDQPRILIQQRLFGLAHGISLLAHACYADPRYGNTLRKAYANWHERQYPAIDRARAELSRFYFGPRGDSASWTDIVTALGLKTNLSLTPGTPQFEAACSTLPQALTEFRNDLSGQYRLQADLTRAAIAAAIAARAEACIKLVDSGHAQALRHGLDAWHRDNDVNIAEAQANLTQHWDEAGLEGSLAKLLDDARLQSQRQTALADCQGLPEWLASPAADPNAPFKAK